MNPVLQCEAMTRAVAHFGAHVERLSHVLANFETSVLRLELLMQRMEEMNQQSEQAVSAFERALSRDFDKQFDARPTPPAKTGE